MGNYSNVQATLEQMPINQFISLPEVFCQRDTELRVLSAAKRLAANPQPTHLDVKIAEFPNGERCVIDGNTRRMVWEMKLSPSPDYVMATIYKVKTNEEAKELYETLDSQLAVEKSDNKIQSAMKIVFKEYVSELQSKMIRGGKYTNALRYATASLSRPNGKKFGWNRTIDDLADAVNTYSFELLFVDQVLYNDGDQIKTHQTQVCAMLLALRKYLNKNNPEMSDRIEEGLEHWLTQSTVPLYSNKKYKGQIDPITWMNRNIALDPTLNVTGADQHSIYAALDIYLYCIDKYMKGQTISRRPRAYGYYTKWMDDAKYFINEIVK